MQFYRRVGDDLILFDRNKTKLEEVKKWLENEAKKAKIRFSKEKENFGNMDKEEFEFHGFLYRNGKLQLPEKNVEKILDTWKKKLKYNKNLPLQLKIQRLKKVLELDNKPRTQSFMQFIRAYHLATDAQQIQNLSKQFFHILSKYMTGGTTYRNMASTKRMLKNFRFNSFNKLFYLYTNGKLK